MADSEQLRARSLPLIIRKAIPPCNSETADVRVTGHFPSFVAKLAYEGEYRGSAGNMVERREPRPCLAVCDPEADGIADQP